MREQEKKEGKELSENRIYTYLIVFKSQGLLALMLLGSNICYYVKSYN